MTALLEGVGLDPYLGFLHQLDPGRPSLALDVMETFRHPVADRFVLNLLNRGMVGAQDFRGGEGPGVFLAPGPMKQFFAEWERWMLAKPKAGGAAWRDVLRRETEKLAAWLRGGAEYQPYRFDEKEVAAACST